MVEKVVKIANKQGIHARPSALIVKTAMKYKDTNITLKKDTGQEANAKSIMTLMSLGAVYDTALTIIVDGPQESEAVQDMADLIVNKKFNEE